MARIALPLAIALLAALSLQRCGLPERADRISLARPAAAHELASLRPSADGTLYVGFDRRLEPKEDVKMYVPLLRYLERETGYRFRLHPTPREGSVVDELGQGKLHFAIVGTLSYLQARDQYGARSLVRGVNAEGRPEYRAAIVTRPTSPIQSVADLEGRTFAFGAVNSTQGHLIPRILLEQAGVRRNDLAAYAYVGSHADVANAVISGRYDAGGMQDTLARSLADRGLVRILAFSSEYPSSGVAVSPDVDPRIVDAVRRALLAFDPAGQDRAGLYQWERTEMPRGFTGSQDSDYADLAQWARRLELLR